MLEDARVVLDGMRRSLDDLPRSLQREKAADAHAGRILLWMWNNREVLPFSDIGQDFANALTWFLVAEDLEEFVWEWLLLEAQAVKDQRRGNFEDYWSTRLRWCQHLLGGFTCAQAYWTNDGVGSGTNAAIRTYLRAAEAFGPHSSFARTVSLVGSATVVDQLLKKQDVDPCDPVLLNRS